jgi:hypothetical protein
MGPGGEVGDLAKSNEFRSAVGVKSGRLFMNSPTLSLFRFQNDPNMPFEVSDEADIGVRGLLEFGI